jgi:2-polyprenyl-3-methyl-5-hydroxy-6-metoxy-1,4-benzoquinol methylase
MSLNAGFKTESFEFLETVEETSFWFRARNELLLRSLLRYAPQASNMLEVGCGTGYVLAGLHAALPDLELCGVELFEQGLEVAARRLPDIELRRLDATELSYESEYDVVGAFDVLEHIVEDRAVLAGCQRALRPQGVLLLTVPQHPWLWSPIDAYSEHVRRYRRAELLEKVRSAGLCPVRCTSFVSLLLPLMLASRLAQRLKAGDVDPASEYGLPTWADRMLEGVLSVERELIARGKDLPVGGSLLCVARKEGLSADASLA